MAIDTPARHVYTGNGNQRVFPIPTKIIGDDYIRIEIDSVYQSDRTKWDIVNNSVIFITAPLNGVTIDIQVATSEEALSVLGSSTAMDIVAESITNVNITATNIVDINTVSHNITEVDTVANNISSVVITANDSDEINILASIHTQLESLYADMAKITSLYNDKITLDSLYSDKAKLDDIFSDLSIIKGLFSIKAKLESIYADKSKLDSIFADKSKLDSIYADKTQLDTIYTNISNILTVYTNISSVIAVSNNIASVNTTASNIIDVNTFSRKYKISYTQPSSPTAGDLWYDTVATVLKYYNGSSYVAVSPDITLLLTNTKFINSISIGNTTLSGWSSSFSVMEGQGGTFFASNGVATLTGSNCYYDGVNWKYKVDGTAGLQLVNQGTHTFRTAASGTAGSNITWVTIASISDTATTLPSNTSIGDVSSTELGYLGGVTSPIQTQLDLKISTQQFDKPTRGPLFIKVSPSSIKIPAGLKLTVGAESFKVVSDYTLTLASNLLVPETKTAGTDYFVYAKSDATFYISSNKNITTDRQIGGFHYGLVGETEAATGNKTEADMVKIRGINAYSFWDLKYRPTASPKGMINIGRRWYDIYLLNSEHITNGTSKAGATIAAGATTNGRAIPKIPLEYGGNGTLTYGKFTWFQACEIAKAHNKQLISYAEFPTIAYGVTECVSSSINGYETVAGKIEHYPHLTSKYGIEQAAGTEWIWGSDLANGYGTTEFAWKDNTDGRGQIYSTSNSPTAVVLGGARDHGVDAGSRASAWGYFVWRSSWDFGCRFACDHLELE